MSGRQFDQDALPDLAEGRRRAGQPGRGCATTSTATPELAIGIPLPDAERVLLRDRLARRAAEHARVARRRRCSAPRSSPPSSGAALGYWISRRTLRPLSNVGVAAEAIAGGRLDTRLEGGDDPDLEVLVTSFNHMAQALEERIERDGRFASDVSHELRSPLMTLAASIEVLATRREEMPDESAQAAVDLMAADIARFQQLVDDLLEISRFDAGVARLSLDEVSPVELVRQAVDASHRPGRAHRGDLPTSTSMVVRADKRRLVRVIANLLDNAEKYGGGRNRRDRGPHGRQRRDRGRGRRCRGARPRTVTWSSTASPAAPVAPAGAPAAATASASAWPWSPSTCACTAARCGWRTAPTAQPRRPLRHQPAHGTRDMSSRARRSGCLLVATLLLVLGVAACGIPKDAEPRLIADEPGLSPTTSPSTDDGPAAPGPSGVLHRHARPRSLSSPSGSGRPSRRRARSRRSTDCWSAGSPRSRTTQASSAASRAAPSSVGDLDRRRRRGHARPERPRSPTSPAPNAVQAYAQLVYTATQYDQRGAEGPLPHRRRAGQRADPRRRLTAPSSPAATTRSSTALRGRAAQRKKTSATPW